jgi:DNA-directed RNA polymerase subunit RPC12/RpoP
LPNYCPYCGAKIPYKDAKFCPNCGFSIIIKTEQVEMASPETNSDKTFPLPDDILNFSKALRGKSINYQTSLSLEQIATFYTHAFTEVGLSKNESFTNITEDSISLVFSNADGKDLVVLQAVDLAYGANIDLRNVNIRTEKRSKEQYVESTEDVEEDDEGSGSSPKILITKKLAEKAIEAPMKELTEEPTSETSKEVVNEKKNQSKKYVVYVDDNFHYQDESERYKLGEFKSCEKAIEACKKIVDEFLERGYVKGISYKDLYEGYHFFGEDPFIISADKKCRFSAWDYAKKRCRELCGEE